MRTLKPQVVKVSTCRSAFSTQLQIASVVVT